MRRRPKRVSSISPPNLSTSSSASKPQTFHNNTQTTPQNNRKWAPLYFPISLQAGMSTRLLCLRTSAWSSSVSVVIGIPIVCDKMKSYIVSQPFYSLRILLTLSGIADRVKNFAVIYVCDLDQVPDFKQMYGR